MKHYGIWIEQTGQWAVFSDGRVFWTTSKMVAQIQLQGLFLDDAVKGARVEEFPEAE